MYSNTLFSENLYRYSMYYYHYLYLYSNNINEEGIEFSFDELFEYEY
jgi:hypothetical protein